MRRVLFPVSLVAAVAILGFVAARPVEALTLVPPSLEFSGTPGQSIDTTVKLFNETNEAVTVTTSTANFGAKGETGEPDFAFDAPLADLASWIKTDVTSVTLQPRETVEVPVKIEVPVGAEPGGHYAGIFFGSGGEGQSQLSIKSQLGSLVIIRVAGNIRETGTVTEFAASPKTHNRLPVDFFLRLQNSGNVHFRPKGFVTIRNMFGGVSATLPINPKEGAVLPNSIRRFDMTWNRNASSNKPGNFFQEIGNEMKNFGLGNYTADVVVTYGTENKTMASTTKFTIFPWRFMLVLLLVVILIIFLISLGLRSYNRMIIKRAQGSSSQNPPAAPKG